MRDDAAAVRLADYAPHPYVIDTVDLAFTLDPQDTLVRARYAVRRRAPDAPAPLRLDGVRLNLERIAIDGAVLAAEAYTVTPEELTILAPPAAFILEIDTRINPAGNTALEGLYVSAGRFCTQCEAEGFRKITYFIDRPDNLARYTVRIEADQAAYPTLLSNGDRVEAGALPGGRHFAVWRDPHPKPSYLFALVAGAFDTIEDAFTTMEGRRVALAIHVDQGDGQQAWYAMDALKRAMAWDEQVFQRAYDLDMFNIVAVRDFNFGAMENKGLNIFNSAYVLADAETATDADFEAIESIVAHEYFHNWTGNRVTCRDWFQLALKEGLTVFRDQEFSADQRSRPVQRIKDVKRLRARQFPEDAGPLAHPVRPASYQKIDNFYTATIYEKGAEVIRMLKALIGPEAFAAGMQLYFQRHDGRAATVEDFLETFADASGQDLTAFARWYAQAGSPVLEAAGRYDPEARTYALTLKQHTPPTPGQPEKAPLPLPLDAGFIAAGGARIAPRLAGEAIAKEAHALVLASAEETFLFEGVPMCPIPAVLRGFSAPVILKDALSEADRIAQMAHEPDAFTRWEAGQAIARALILSGRAHHAEAVAGFAEALRAELARADQDPAFAALALRIPELAELMQTAPTPDPEALFAAREALRRHLARALHDQVVAAAQTTAEDRAPVDLSAAAAGRRALQSAALDLAAALGAPGAVLAQAVFAEAPSMTQKMAALEALGANAAAGPAYDAALDAFYARWREKPLVIDKWFSVQAACPHGGLQRVEALRAHADFTLRNPNRARALAMAFAVRNGRGFHAADGGGYRFLGAIIAEMDAINPGVAARLATAFEAWRRFDATRQGHARAVLEEIAAKPGLSANLSEVIGRTLG